MVNLQLYIMVVVGLISFVSTFCFVPLYSRLATVCGLMDVPNNTIKKHARPTPYLGGVAVYSGFLVGVIIFSLFLNTLFSTHTSLFVLVGTTPLLFLGLFDDIKPLKARQKFLGQCVIVFFLLLIAFHVKPSFFSTYWHMSIFMLWILTMVNAFNLIDVMDGLATTVALGATGSFLSVALLQENYDVALLLIAFGGSLLAFLWYNRPLAQIYLGDAGSLWIGGVLATMPLFFDWSSHNPYGFLTPVVILSIPLIEVVSLIIIRSYKGIPFYLGSPHHFCHYLLANGWSKQEILAYVAIISLILNLVACLFVSGALTLLALIAIGVACLAIWLIFLLFKR